MVERTQKEMIQELFQAVIGIPESPDDNGLIGDIAEIKRVTVGLNGKIQKNKSAIDKMKGALIVISVLGTGISGFTISQIWGG